MKFEVVVGLVSPNLKYEWEVNQGEIIKGQGTHEIMVSGGQEGTNLKATVKIDGIADGCETSASALAGIAQKIEGDPSDEWGTIKPNDQKSRLDSFLIQLENNPTYIGSIILVTDHKERLDPTNDRIRFIVKHAKFRKFDIIRLVFGLELAETRSTSLWIVPPGAKLPCDKCLVINGSDLK
ncbi:MAG: hypothetical protein WKF92_04690 [Pyrinomonadaceae bacterium]